MSELGDSQNGKITRRDFLDGVAIGAAGLAAAAAMPHLTGAEAALAAVSANPPVLPPGYYPPTSTGLTGTPDSVVQQTIKIDGLPTTDVHSTKGGPGIDVGHVKDVDGIYDCVIVGAGASGLAAAKFYRDRFGPSSKILVLDPLPDFGGHSHRNEFHVPNAAAGNADVMILRNGGTVNLDSIGTWNKPANGLLDIPGSYGQPSLDLLAFCGVDYNAFPSSTAAGIPASFGLRQMLLFPSRDWGTDTLVQNRVGNAPWPDLPRDDAVLAGGAGGDRAHPDRHDDRLDRAPARPEDRPGEEGDPRRDHAEAVLHGLRRRARAVHSLVPAQRARPARRGRPGGRRRRRVGARPGRVRGARAQRRTLPRDRPHAAVRAAGERRADPRVARRQRVAAAAARQQADPGVVRRRRRRPSEPGEHRQGARATTRRSTGRGTPCGSACRASSSASTRRARRRTSRRCSTSSAASRSACGRGTS